MPFKAAVFGEGMLFPWENSFRRCRNHMKSWCLDCVYIFVYDCLNDYHNLSCLDMLRFTFLERERERERKTCDMYSISYVHLYIYIYTCVCAEVF